MKAPKGHESATAPAAAVPGTARGRLREEAILAAAVELVGEVGYERVTCDAIAARARSSKATIYRRWPGKAEVVAEALRRQAQGTGALTLPDTGSLRGDLLAAVAATANGITGAAAGGASLLGLVDGVRDDAVLRDRVRSQIAAASTEAGRIVCDRAAERGELGRGVDAGRVMHLAVAQLLLSTLLDGRAPAADEQADLVDAVLLPLLRTTAATR